MAPVAGLAGVRRYARTLAQHERRLLRGGEPPRRRHDVRAVRADEEAAHLGQPVAAARQQVARRGGAALEQDDDVERGSREPRLEREQQRERVLERAARDTAALHARADVDDALHPRCEVRAGAVREQHDRCLPEVGLDRRDGLTRSAPGRHGDHDRVVAGRGQQVAARELRDRVDAVAAQPGRGERGREVRGAHPDQDIPRCRRQHVPRVASESHDARSVSACGFAARSAANSVGSIGSTPRQAAGRAARRRGRSASAAGGARRRGTRGTPAAAAAGPAAARPAGTPSRPRRARHGTPGGTLTCAPLIQRRTTSGSTPSERFTTTRPTWSSEA